MKSRFPRLGAPIPPLDGFLYDNADNIILLSESEHDLQKHLNALDDFCTQRGLVMNLAKTKVLIFYTSSRVRSKCHLIVSHKLVEVVGSYVYLGVTFSARSGKFPMTHAAKDRLTRGYASLSLLERQCHDVVAWLAQKRSVARTKDNVKVRKESPGFWTEETKRVEM